MAQEQADDTLGNLIVTTSRPDRLPPPWLAGALVVLDTVRIHGLWTTLRDRLHVARRRAGTYVALDFVLLLMVLALAGSHDIKALFVELPQVAMPLVAVWGSVRLPSRSALSRFLAAVRSQDVEVVRELVLQDVIANGLQGEPVGGLVDRDGTRAVIFDDDGTYHGAQQRDLAADEHRPAPERRSAQMCARGHHGGSKRADVTCNRTVLQQAHTHEWLGCWSAPGNGQPFEQLVPACKAVVAYLLARGLTKCQGVMRLDGLYGIVRVAALIGSHGLGYLMRCKDYRLLRLRIVQQVLTEPPHATYAAPDSPVRREAWQVLQVPWTSSKDPTMSVQTRLVITRRPASSPGKPRIGVRQGDWVYELFVTDRSASGWSIEDVLSLYFGRGGFEGTLAQEDREHDLDRTISWCLEGQQLWTLFGQLVWNMRIRMGALLQPNLVRTTEWSPAAPPSAAAVEAEPNASSIAAERTAPHEILEPTVPTIAEQPTDLRMPAANPEPAAPPSRTASSDGLDNDEAPASTTAPSSHASVGAGPTPGSMQRRIATATTGRGTGRFGGDDFKWTPDDQLRCPAGKLLHRTRQRIEPRQLRVIYTAAPKDCHGCDLTARCLGRPKHADGVRSVSVLEPLPVGAETGTAPPAAIDPPPTVLSSVPPAVVAAAATAPHSLAPRPALSSTSTPVVPPIPPLGPNPVLWFDIEALSARSRLRQALDGQRVDVFPLLAPSSPAPRARPQTRDQRAHRRQTWAQRTARNRCPLGGASRLCIHGVPDAINDFLGQRRAIQDAA